MNEDILAMSNIFDKLQKAYNLMLKKVFSEFINKLLSYIRYHLKDKWQFIYFELDLTTNSYSLPDMKEEMVVRRALPEDIAKIKNDLYPYMGAKQEFDKRYIDKIGKGNYSCFIAEVDHKVVHYFMAFNTAFDSPIMQTPLDKQKITEKDAYFGNAFTIPDERGKWIVPHVILSIIDYFKNETSSTRALLLVHSDTPGAVGFFSRLGFKIIEDAYPKKFIYTFFKN